MEFLTTSNTTDDTYFGLALTTHRERLSSLLIAEEVVGTNEEFDISTTALSLFQYERVIASIAILFCRWTIPASNSEPNALRAFFALLLAVLAYAAKGDYVLLTAVHLFSYALPIMLVANNNNKTTTAAAAKKSRPSGSSSSTMTTSRPQQQHVSLVRLLAAIGVSACLSLLVSHVLWSAPLWSILFMNCPDVVTKVLNYMFPIGEIHQAYQVLLHFQNPAILHQQMTHLFVVTFYIQVGMGYLGIDFLKKEQARRNQLARMDMLVDDDDDTDGDKDSKKVNGAARTSTTSASGSSAAASPPLPLQPHGSDNSTRSTTPAANAPRGTPKPTTTTTTTTTTKQEASRRFQKSAAPFILFTAVPYMLQIIAFGNMNRFAFLCVQHDLSRVVRHEKLFAHDANLIAMANDSATSPGAYATSMDTVVNTVYELFNRKLFSIPKLMLLPGIMTKQPLLVAQISPFIFGSDYLKGRFISYMTSKAEKLTMEAKEISAVRTKVEAFDMKNAELLQRSGRGATQFTRRKWEELSVKIQQKRLVADLLKRTKGFFSFIQRNFVFSVLIDCALANLIAMGKIVSAEIFVFSRAIEDAVDLVLMRSRAESEIAQMMTEMTKLQQLADVWEASRTRMPMPCAVASPDVEHPGIVVRNLHYSRGSATVRIDYIELPPGMYALTGVNGSGKSTLFRVFMSCDTNEKTIDLPDSIVLSTPSDQQFTEAAALPDESCIVADNSSDVVHNDIDDSDEVVPRAFITMPSADVAEISQSFYWPLYTRPVDWIYQCHLLEEKEEAEAMLRRAAEELQSLEFRQVSSFAKTNSSPEGNSTGESDSTAMTSDDPFEASVVSVMEELMEVKEDWFNDLSGGQKSKVELVRKVFLHEKCPSVLLIDETLAPLDPGSKSLVMTKLKRFCSDSVVIVIYHTDVRESEEGESIECVPSNDFFYENIHLVNHTLVHRPVC